MSTTDTTTVRPDDHEALVVKLADLPVVRLRKAAPEGTSKMRKDELVALLASEHPAVARDLAGVEAPEPAKAKKLTNAQKQAIGDLLVKAAADLLDDLPEGVDRGLAADWLGSIMVYTPRTFVDVDGERKRWWDARLPYNAPKSWRDR